MCFVKKTCFSHSFATDKFLPTKTSYRFWVAATWSSTVFLLGQNLFFFIFMEIPSPLRQNPIRPDKKVAGFGLQQDGHKHVFLESKMFFFGFHGDPHPPPRYPQVLFYAGSAPMNRTLSYLIFASFCFDFDDWARIMPKLMCIDVRLMCAQWPQYLFIFWFFLGGAVGGGWRQHPQQLVKKTVFGVG